MIKRTLLRSGIQLLGLCVLALVLSATRVQAMSNSCEEQSAECASHCGSSWSWDVTGQMWDQQRMIQVWDPQLGWVWINEPGYVPVYGATFGPDVDYWECIPEDSGNGICMCRY